MTATAGLRLSKPVLLIPSARRASSRRSKTELGPRSPSTLVLTLTHSILPVSVLCSASGEGQANDRLVDAPATGTPETGGWSTRELRTIIRGLEGVNFIAADIVEVAPAYDTNAELTTMAAADTLYEVMSLMVKKGPLSNMLKENSKSS